MQTTCDCCMSWLKYSLVVLCALRSDGEICPDLFREPSDHDWKASDIMQILDTLSSPPNANSGHTFSCTDQNIVKLCLSCFDFWFVHTILLNICTSKSHSICKFACPEKSKRKSFLNKIHPQSGSLQNFHEIQRIPGETGKIVFQFTKLQIICKK